MVSPRQIPSWQCWRGTCSWHFISSLHDAVGHCKPIEQLFHDDHRRHRYSEYMTVFSALKDYDRDLWPFLRPSWIVNYDGFYGVRDQLITSCINMLLVVCVSDCRMWSAMVESGWRARDGPWQWTMSGEGLTWGLDRGTQYGMKIDIGGWHFWTSIS